MDTHTHILQHAAHADKFEFVAGSLCLDFVNTINYAGVNQNERLKTYADMVEWGYLIELLSGEQVGQLLDEAERRPADTQTALGQARKLRRLLHRTFATLVNDRLPLEADIDEFNASLSVALEHLRLVPGEGGFAWQWSPTNGDLQPMLWPVIWSAAQLLVEADLQRIKMCSGKGCSWLFHDHSKNRSRRWCDMQHCGNRAKARRYYERKRT